MDIWAQNILLWRCNIKKLKIIEVNENKSDDRNKTNKRLKNAEKDSSVVCVDIKKENEKLDDSNLGGVVEPIVPTNSNEPMKLLVCHVTRGFSADVVQTARDSGSEGAVIIEGRGLGQIEKKFFGLRIEPENELVFIAVPERLSVKIPKAIYSKFFGNQNAKVMVFVLPVSSYYL